MCNQAHVQEWMHTHLSCGHDNSNVPAMYHGTMIDKVSTEMKRTFADVLARSLIPTKLMLILCSTSLSHKC